MSAPDPAAAAPENTSVDTPRPAAGNELRPRRTVARVLKDIVLFFAAPFVTLAYVALFPFIGLAMLWQARRHPKETS